MTDQATISRAEVVEKINEILLSETSDPATELQKLGEVLIKIGKVLDGLSVHDARAVMRSVQILADPRAK